MLFCSYVTAAEHQVEGWILMPWTATSTSCADSAAEETAHLNWDPDLLTTFKLIFRGQTSYRPGLRIWKATLNDNVLPFRHWPRLLRGVWQITAESEESSLWPRPKCTYLHKYIYNVVTYSIYIYTVEQCFTTGRSSPQPSDCLTQHPKYTISLKVHFIYI